MMMTRLLISILTLITLSAFPSRGAEKVLLSTDRKVYVAGDRVRLSAFCMEGDSLSDHSAIAYVEVHNTSTMVQTAKIALSSGRGACELELPGDMPTGNYAVLAYTVRQCVHGVAPEAEVISVFNTSSSARVEGGVKVLPRGSSFENGPCVSLPEGMDVRVQGDSLVAENSSSRTVSLSIGVSIEDGIPSPSFADVPVFWPEGRVLPSVPEYEGEIISGKVVGLDPSQLERLHGKSVFISAPGGKSDIYSAPLAHDGSFRIFTSNLFGRTDLVCEVEGMPLYMAGHVELDDPFIDWQTPSISPLSLCADWAPALQKRGFASQVERLFGLEGFDRQLDIPTGWSFGDEAIVYDLEDYTRFTTMKEVFTEFIPEIRYHGSDRDGYSISVRVFDAYGNAHYSEGSSLMMVDGIPVFDKNRIISYDPLLVRRIKIYPYQYFLGERSFEGVVDLETYQHNAPGLKFDADVRVVEWGGTDIPSAVVAASDDIGSGIPDYRQTVLWQPLLRLAPGQSISFPLPEGIPVVISSKGMAL